MEINLNNFCDALIKSDGQTGAEDICETDGEQYLYDNIVSKFITGIPVYMSDIDFSAFTEDDIVSSLAEYEKKGYVPYNVTTNSNYYYIWRKINDILSFFNAIKLLIQAISTIHTNQYCNCQNYSIIINREA